MTVPPSFSSGSKGSLSHLLFYDNPQPLWVYDLESLRFLDINQATIAQYGYCRGDLLAMRIVDICAVEDVPHLTGALLHAQPRWRDLGTWRLRKADGTMIEVEVSTHTLTFAGIPAALALTRDVTAQRQAERRYRTLFESIPIGIELVDEHGNLTDVNPTLEQMLGYSAEELVGRHWTKISHPEDVDAEAELDREMDEGSRVRYQLDKRFIRRDGQAVWARLTSSDVGSIALGDFQFSIGMVEDISEQRRAHEALQRLASLVQATHDAIIGTRLDGVVTSWNPGAVQLFGYTAEEAMGRHIGFIIPDHHVGELELIPELAMGKSLTDFETMRRRKDGRIVDVSVTISPIRDDKGMVVGLSSIARDVGERKAYEEQLRHQALHDGLTGLPNRTLFLDRLAQVLAQARRSRFPVAVLILDLNQFKDINDTFGHEAGDTVSRQVSERFAGQLRNSDTLARLGGDEFGVVLAHTNEKRAMSAATRLLESLVEPFTIDAQPITLTASVGIVLSPQHGYDATKLVRQADIAMYRAKRTARGYAVYEAGADVHSARRMALTASLWQGIEGGQLILHYQPKVELLSGHANQVEALLRWNHPQYGSIPPADFIPAAEASGLIRPLTAWVLREALRQVAEWSSRGLRVSVGVNVSTWNLHDPELVAIISGALSRSGLPASALRLEITESSLMVDPDRSVASLRTLHNMGIAIAIDDFGTGFSSMAYLTRLPVKEIKIDRSFVLDMMADREEAAIVARSIIDLGHNLGLQVTAEGIETRGMLDALTNMGCDLAQGYFLSRPIPPEDAFLWLRERSVPLPR